MWFKKKKKKTIIPEIEKSNLEVNEKGIILNGNGFKSYDELISATMNLKDPIVRALAFAIIAYFGITRETFDK